MKIYNLSDKGKEHSPAGVPGFTIHQNVNIEKARPLTGESKIFKGQVISITDKFIVVKNHIGIKESFTYVDFQIKMVRCV